MNIVKTEDGKYTLEVAEVELIYIREALDGCVKDFTTDAMRPETYTTDRYCMLESAATCAKMIYDIEKTCEAYADPDGDLPELNIEDGTGFEEPYARTASDKEGRNHGSDLHGPGFVVPKDGKLYCTLCSAYVD